MDYIPVVFEPNSKTPLYYQLYSFLAQQIRCGALRPQEQLPARRSAAANLGVSRNTVESAYALLEEEGYIECRSRSGHYVRDISPLAPAVAAPPAVPKPAPSAPEFQFSTRSMDASLFPAKTWARIEKEVLSGSTSLLNHGLAQGDENLRRVIAAYLAQYRAVRCTPEQIVVGAGTEYLLGLLAGLLNGRRVAVEDPGYEKTSTVLHNNGIKTVAVPVDEAGMRVDALDESGAKVAYVTPSHQFPTGAAMPAGRRTALLAWAEKRPERLIIEDDYDSEFRFSGRPIPSLQGLSATGQAVYLGTFTKSIAPSIRIAYLVLPHSLLAPYHEKFGSYSSTVSRFEQQTLARFIDEGHFTRYLNRARNAYRRRRDRLIAALMTEFGADKLRFGPVHTGLYLTVTFKVGLSEAQMVRRAAAARIAVAGLSGYYRSAQQAPGATLVLGYAGMEEERIDAAVHALARAFWEREETAPPAGNVENSVETVEYPQDVVLKYPAPDKYGLVESVEFVEKGKG